MPSTVRISIRISIRIYIYTCIRARAHIYIIIIIIIIIAVISVSDSDSHYRSMGPFCDRRHCRPTHGCADTLAVSADSLCLACTDSLRLFCLQRPPTRQSQLWTHHTDEQRSSPHSRPRCRPSHMQ